MTPHTIRSDETDQNADVRPLIGCVVSTLAGLASPFGPIAAGSLQTVPAFTDSPHPSVIRTMHPRSQQSHCRHLRLVQELRRNIPGKISRPAIAWEAGPANKLAGEPFSPMDSLF